jgi:uncharacterized membrane protein YgaE (UPF0421/DUF939 family)
VIISLKGSLARVKDSLWQIMQLVIASFSSYLIAHFALGHPVPLLSVTVAISSLGFTRDTRPGRVASTAIAMVVGVLISETLLIAFGHGAWQLSLAIAVSLLLARAFSKNPAFALTVTLQAVLVQMLTAPTGGPFARVLDGLVGGLVALSFTALLPRNPIKLARRDAAELFALLKKTLADLRQVALTGDPEVADAALGRIRKTQPLVDNWHGSLESAQAISRISPLYRWAQLEIAQQRQLLDGMDLATRNLRVITRRVDFLLQDGKSLEKIAPLFSKLLIAADLLEQSVDDFSMRAKAKKYLEKLIVTLDPVQFEPKLSLAETVLLMQMRPMTIDLAIAAGLDATKARRLLPKVD